MTRHPPASLGSSFANFALATAGGARRTADRYMASATTISPWSSRIYSAHTDQKIAEIITDT
jgi:hypothetical protein